MPKVEELERCYVGFATRDRAKVHFFDGSVLEPIEVRHGNGGFGYASQKADTGLSILRDYLERTESANRAEALAQAFTEQFLSELRENEVLFIEEFRIQDWLRVMRMLGQAA